MVNRWRCFALSVALAVSALINWPIGQAQETTNKANTIQSDVDEAIRASARFLNGRTDYATKVLKNIGFDPSDLDPAIPPEFWKQYPTQRKIAIAYVSAVEANPASGGERFLALLSRSLAQQYESSRDLKVIRDRIETREDGTIELKNSEIGDTIPFKRPKSLAKLDQRVSVEVANAIRSVADFLSTGKSLGTVANFIDRTVPNGKRPPTNVIMMSADSVADALLRAVSPLSQEEQRAVAQKMVSEVRTKYEQAAYIPAFRGFGPEDAPPSATPLNPNRPLKPNDGGGLAKDRYSKAMKDFYLDPEARTPEKMQKRVRGFGGIIFGAKVEGKQIGKPNQMTFSRTAESPDIGTLVLSFRDGKKFNLHSVSLESFVVAVDIVTNQSAKDWESGFATGLLGLGESEGFVRDRGIRLRQPVTLHPALNKTDLAWSLAVLDATPHSGQRQLVELVRKKFGGDAAHETKLMFEASRDANIRALIFVDVPTQLATRGDKVILSRADVSDVSEVHRETAFVEVHSEIDAKSGDFDRDLAERWYDLMPTLVASSADINRVNQFAKVFSVVRWWKASGGQFGDGVETLPRNGVGVPDFVATLVSPRLLEPNRGLLTEQQELDPLTPIIIPIQTKP